MKTLFTFFTVSILFFGQLKSQINPCPSDNDEFPGCTICNQTIGTTANKQAESILNNLCFQEDNSQWFVIYPSDDTLQFSIEVPDCFIGSGVEFMLLDSDLNQVGVCGEVSENETQTFEFYALTPFEKYYLFLDGQQAANCIFKINILKGGTPPIQNPYHIEWERISYNNYKVFAEPVVEGVTYHWEIKNGSFIEEIGPGEITALLFENSEICLSLSNHCEASTTFCQQANILTQPGDPCGTPTDNPPGCVVCRPVLIGNTAGYSPEAGYNFPCGRVENSQWIQIIADNSNLSVNIEVENCQNIQGLEMALYDMDYNLVSNCFQSQPGQLNGSVEINNAIPGDFYYLMIDGKDADICDFTLTIIGQISGDNMEQTKPIQQSPDVPTICPGSTITYSTETVQGFDYYEWEVPINGTIISGQGSTSIDVLWHAAGAGVVLVEAVSACWTAPPETIPVFVLPIPRTIETVVSCDTSYTGEVVFESYLGCDSIVSYQFIQRPNISFYDLFLCEGEEVSFNGQTYSGEGYWNIVIENSDQYGCDSIINLGIRLYPVSAEIETPSILPCNSPNPIILHAANKYNDPLKYDYQWSSGSGGNIIGSTDQDSVLVDQPGKYYLEVAYLGGPGSILCSTRDSVLVGTSSNLLPDWENTFNEACTGSELSFSILNQPEFLAYNWTVQNGDFISISNENALISFQDSGQAEVCVQVLDSCGWSTPLCQNLMVYETPVIDLEIPKKACLNDELVLNFPNAYPAGANFEWVIVNEQDTIRSFDPTPLYTCRDTGIHKVFPKVIFNGCISGSDSFLIYVGAPLDTPEISCVASASSVLFSWNTVPGAEAYDIYINNVRVAIQQSASSYLIENRNPETEVKIEVRAFGNNGCGYTPAFASCFTEACPPAPITFSRIEVCNNDEPINLNPSYGCTWFGNGVETNTCNYLPEGLNPGLDTVYLDYQEGRCRYQIPQEVEILESPEITAAVQSSVFFGGLGNISLDVQNGTGSETYDWSDANTAPFRDQLIPGSYCVTVTGNNGCETNSCHQILPAEYSVPSIVFVCPNKNKIIQVKPSTGIDLKWIPSSGLSCDDCATPTVNISTSSIYTLIGETDDGRRDTTSVFVLVLPQILCGFFKEAPTKEDLEKMLDLTFDDLSVEEIQEVLDQKFEQENATILYPNPSKGSFTLLSENELDQIRIFDIVGKQIFFANPKQTTFEVNLEHEAEGIYFIKIKSDNKIETKKLYLKTSDNY
ncbi:MAG: T9SS type A sorting domain-containing protein [Saprospiraceae bacterium]